jgi:hypothetical protein
MGTTDRARDLDDGPCPATPTWQRDRRVLWRRSGDRVVLMPPGRMDIILLEGTGAVTWHLLDAPMEHDELVRSLAASFDIAAATVDVDVKDFLNELAGIGAVVRS